MPCSRHGARGERRARTAATTVMLLMICTASAEMSEQDYRSATVLKSPAEQSRIAAELEAARVREAEAAERQVEQARLQAQRRAEQLARRPLGEQLIDARCTACHTAAVLDGVRRSPWGWRWTVERMRWWHGAKLTTSEAVTLAEHLHERRPAGETRAWMERGLALLVVIGPIAAWRFWLSRRRRAGAASRA